jgi:hypothetical protein
MNKMQRFQKNSVLTAGMLFIVPCLCFGALNDEMKKINSSIQGYAMNNEAKIDEEANRLAVSYGAELISFTQTHIKTADRLSQWLLLRAITKLPDKPAVQNALYNLAMSETGFLHEAVITAVSLCDRESILNVALRLSQNAQSVQAANSALELMELFGNDATISSLAHLEESTKSGEFKKTVSAARKNLEQRTVSSAAQQRDWDRYAIPYWRIPREVPFIRSITEEYYVKAALLNKRGYRFPAAFLKDRLQKKDPLAAALLALQKENGSLEDLNLHLSDKGAMKDVCQRGISHISGKMPVDVSEYFSR